jgi:hypothetical protein
VTTAAATLGFPMMLGPEISPPGKLNIVVQNKCSIVSLPWTAEQQRAYNAQYYASHRESEIRRVTSRQRAAADVLNTLRRVLIVVEAFRLT